MCMQVYVHKDMPIPIDLHLKVPGEVSGETTRVDTSGRSIACRKVSW